jgi:glutamine cyclotransferase
MVKRIRMKWRARWNRGTAWFHLHDGTIIKVKRDPSVPPKEWAKLYAEGMRRAGDSTWQLDWNGTTSVVIQKLQVAAIEVF